MAEEKLSLPLPPWTHENLGEVLYCRLAKELGFFNPASESKDFRPPLDPTPFLDRIRSENAGAKKEK